MVGLTLEHVEIKGGCMIHRESFGRCSPEGLRRVRRYGRCSLSEKFRDIGKPMFGRVSGPLFSEEIVYVCVVEDTVWILGYK